MMLAYGKNQKIHVAIHYGTTTNCGIMNAFGTLQKTTSLSTFLLY